ncbi:DELLA protein RGL2-like [Salvia splendens]|uniref:DELLA protein RGL2-like n=1 Tax=Salvia splendens TaxID=180675 RepID=UPI001C25F9BA|nr:DELLA protein RGL2-like [Salvia splendens]
MSTHNSSIAKISDIAAVYQKLPLNQVIQFTGIHSVADHVSRSRKVNIVDLNICCGTQMMILIQNLAERSDHPIERVRITVVAASSDPSIEEAGFRLKILAESLKLNFSFHVVSLEYVLNHQENALDLDPEETVVVHAAFALRHMITDPDRLEALMKFIRSINPSLMIMIEAEANVNSPIFVTRFVEALFFYGANFEYVEDCLESDGERSCLEIGFFGPAIRNIVAAEGEERKFRIVGINVWRKFFERFGMVETEFSTLAIGHVNLVLERFDCGDSGTHCMNGKCLVFSKGLNLMKKPVPPPFQMSTEDEFDSFEAFGEGDADRSLVQSANEEKDLLAQVATLDDLYLTIVSSPFQFCDEEIAKLSGFNSQNSPLVEANEEEKSYAFPPASMEILRGCRSRIRLSNEPEVKAPPPSEMSINHVIKLAAANFVQSTMACASELYAISHPYADAFVDLSKENAADVRLVQDLLSSAERVNNHQFDSASKLLEECHRQSFKQMNKTQRLVYYFTQALFEKIGRGRGKCTNKMETPRDPTAPSSATAAFFEKLPFSQITQFAAVQSMVECISGYRKVHVVDLELRCGVHQTVLMQALAAARACTVHFKITAIAIEASTVIEEAGVRLRAIATSLNVDFSFNVLTLEDVFNLQISVFDLDDDEAVIVHSAHALEKLVSRPRELDVLMRIIRRINPHVMVITEAEGNVNSPAFVDRFVESLLFCGAYFDSLGDLLRNGGAERSFIEANILSPVVRNTVAAEGGERGHRIVGIEVWRAFLGRFGMEEMELSQVALTHARMILDRFECGDCCTIGFNGDSLIVSWKETPICSLSVWKFR